MIDAASLERVVAAQQARLPFSGVILLREQGRMLLANGFGLANRSEALPNTLTTRSGTASGTKTFTAVAICQLVDKGLLAFDSALKDCLDIAFPAFNPAITVHLRSAVAR